MKDCKVGIIDLGAQGNTASITNALIAAGGIPVIVTKSNLDNSLDRYVLPGVGSFPAGMSHLRASGLDLLIKDVAGNKPILGICLGMQLMATIGYEFKKENGLNLVNGEIKLMECSLPVPHIGFKPLVTIEKNDLFKGIDDKAEFYFMHSFEFVNYTEISTLTEYGEHRFVSSVHTDNIFGVQFHPEKSRDNGIRLLKNFLRM